MSDVIWCYLLLHIQALVWDWAGLQLHGSLQDIAGLVCQNTWRMDVISHDTHIYTRISLKISETFKAFVDAYTFK